MEAIFEFGFTNASSYVDLNEEISSGLCGELMTGGSGLYGELIREGS